MDPVKILKRSWHILWNYRALWVFGLILALTAASSSPGNSNRAQYNLDESDFQNGHTVPGEIQDAFKEAGREIENIFENGLPSAGISGSELTAMLWLVAVFVLLMIVLGLVMAVLRYVSETAVIRMVDEYEATDTKLTVRQGFRIGWSRTSWRLFLINLIVNLPAFLLLAVLAIAGFVVYTMVSGNNEAFAAAGTISVIGFLFLFIFIVAIMSIVLNLLRQFFWRACALEDVGVGEALRLGYQMVRENWKNVGLMWLIMIGLGIAWVLVAFIAFLLLIPVVIITSIIAAFIAAVPGLLLVGLFSLFMSGYLPWIIAGVFVAPLFFTLAFSPWVVLDAWKQVFVSTVWTLTYRELKALPDPMQEIVAGPVGD